MPISTPATPAMTPPNTMDRISRTTVFSMLKEFSSQVDATMPENAPMLMNPA